MIVPGDAEGLGQEVVNRRSPPGGGRRLARARRLPVIRLLRYLLLRLVGVIPQVVGATVVMFLLLKLLPNPAYELLGPFASKQDVVSAEKHLGLTKPLYDQYFIYLGNLAQGKLGVSWFDGASVSHELAVRVGPTLELISLSLIIIVVVGIGAGTFIGMSRKRTSVVGRIVDLYGLLAGAFPDFWLALVLAFLFTYKLRWLPAPLGQLAPGIAVPPRITGAVGVDALLSGDWSVFGQAVAHLVLPVATLVLIYMAPIVKITQATVREMRESEFCRHAVASGLPRGVVIRYALRNSLAPIATLTAVMYGYLFGGDVLVENVFSWGGVGSWAVQSVAQSDFPAIEGFLIVAVVMNVVLYLVVDVFYMLIDPRLVIAG